MIGKLFGYLRRRQLLGISSPYQVSTIDILCDLSGDYAEVTWFLDPKDLAIVPTDLVDSNTQSKTT